MSIFEAIYLANLKMGVVALPLFIVGFVGWVYIIGLSHFFYKQRKGDFITGKKLKKYMSEGTFPKKRDKLFVNFYAYYLFFKLKKGKHFVSDIFLFRSRYEINVSGKLSSIKIMASVSPLLGLLGTVNGIIHTFLIIIREGSANAVLLSDGISEALLTTEAGLVIAVPLIFMHTILKNEFNKSLDQMNRLEKVVMDDI